MFLAWFVIFSSCSKTPQKRVDDKTEKTINEKPQAETKSVDEDTVYSVIGVGDIMMGTNYPSTASLPPDDGKYLFEDVAELLSSADVTFGNLEGTLLNSGGTPKRPKDPEDGSHSIAFRMPERYAEYLKLAGFDMMGIANNHSGDMGDEGRISTKNTLEKYDLKYAGYITCPTAVFIKDGIKFGLIAFAPNNGTVPLNDDENAAKLVAELKKKVDILIVSFHGGAEGTGSQRVTGRREIFLGEDRGNVLDFAHNVVDAGADIVFGQGPHVTRAMELYNNRLIAYSLGNFCTYGKFGLSGALGVAPILKVYVDKQGRFLQGRIFPVKQIKHGIPVFDDDYKVVNIVRELTSKDFPNTPLSIDNEGKITINK
jgi:hypothetical protein